MRGGQCFLMKLQLPQLKVSSVISRKLQLLLPKDRVTESFIMKLQLPQLKTSSAPSRKLQLLLPKDKVTECFITKLQLSVLGDRLICTVHSTNAAAQSNDALRSRLATGPFTGLFCS
jgi:hypothetical protein